MNTDLFNNLRTQEKEISWKMKERDNNNNIKRLEIDEDSKTREDSL